MYSEFSIEERGSTVICRYRYTGGNNAVLFGYLKVGWGRGIFLKRCWHMRTVILSLSARRYLQPYSVSVTSCLPKLFFFVLFSQFDLRNKKGYLRSAMKSVSGFCSLLDILHG